LEHRMGFEPMNTGFADQRVSHFAIGALVETVLLKTLSKRLRHNSISLQVP
jgi:hypothetical protein